MAYVLFVFLGKEIPDMGFKIASRACGLGDGAFREAFGTEEAESVRVAVDAGPVDGSDEGGGESALLRGLDGGLRGNRGRCSR